MTYTPGPWRYDVMPTWYPWPESIEIIGEGETIAWLTANAGQRGRDEANAHLIAAAPKMLEALKAVDAEALAANERGDFISIKYETWDLVQQAIVEATGKP